MWLDNVVGFTRLLLMASMAVSTTSESGMSSPGCLFMIIYMVGRVLLNVEFYIKVRGQRTQLTIQFAVMINTVLYT